MILLHCFGIGINERMETSTSARNDDSSLARPSCYYITVVNEAVGNDYLKFFKRINQHKATYNNTTKRTSALNRLKDLDKLIGSTNLYKEAVDYYSSLSPNTPVPQQRRTSTKRRKTGSSTSSIPSMEETDDDSTSSFSSSEESSPSSMDRNTNFDLKLPSIFSRQLPNESPFHSFPLLQCSMIPSKTVTDDEMSFYKDLCRCDLTDLMLTLATSPTPERDLAELLNDTIEDTRYNEDSFRGNNRFMFYELFIHSKIAMDSLRSDNTFYNYLLKAYIWKQAKMPDARFLIFSRAGMKEEGDDFIQIKNCSKWLEYYYHREEANQKHQNHWWGFDLVVGTTEYQICEEMGLIRPNDAVGYTQAKRDMCELNATKLSTKKKLNMKASSNSACDDFLSLP